MVSIEQYTLILLHLSFSLAASKIYFFVFIILFGGAYVYMKCSMNYDSWFLSF